MSSSSGQNQNLPVGLKHNIINHLKNIPEGVVTGLRYRSDHKLTRTMSGHVTGSIIIIIIIKIIRMIVIMIITISIIILSLLP